MDASEENDGNAICAFLQDLESSDDEDTALQKRGNKPIAVDTRIAPPPKQTIEVNTKSNNLLLLRGARPSYSGGMKGQPLRGGYATNLDSNNADDDSQHAPSSDIDLASIRAVCKEEKNGAKLLECLDERAGCDPTAEPSVQKRMLAAPLDAMVLDNVLSDHECRRLIDATEAMGFSFWHPSSDRKDFRNADTIEVTSTDLAERVWGRMRGAVPPRVVIDKIRADGGANGRWAPDLGGTWEAVGLNPCLLFNRYGIGGHFSPHTDGYTIQDFNTRSLYSCLLYLNECQQGGATRMMEESGDTLGDHCQETFIKDTAGRLRFPDERIKDSVSPAPGRALLFFQDTLHEGEPVGAGVKYMIRSDVMYRRVPPICDGPNDREAYAAFREAELMEADGHVTEAAALFRKCARLSPALAGVYGL